MSSPLVSTLFRLAVPRAPEPVPSTPGQFISNRNLANSAIYSKVLQGNSPETAAAGFSNPVLDVKSSTGAALFDFSVWLAANRSVLTNAAIVSNGAGLSPLGANQLAPLWDSFYQQAILRSSADNSDQLARVLIAQEILTALSQDPELSDEKLRQIARAAIVIPNELSRGMAAGSEYTTNLPPAPYNGNKYISQSLEVVMATEKLQRVRKAIKELSAVSSNHDKAEKAHYADARKQWSASAEAVIAAKIAAAGTDPAAPPYTAEDLPDFIYTPLPEMDAEALNTELSPESRYLVNTELTDKATFAGALAGLEAAEAGLNKLIFDAVDFNRQYVVAGGARIPVKNMPRIQSDDYGFLIRSVQVDASSSRVIALAIDTAGETPELASASFTVNNVAVAPQQVKDASNANHLGLYFRVDNLTIPSDGRLNIEGEITMPSGFKFAIAPNPTDKAVSPGRPEIGNPDNGSPQVPGASKYGLKRLGIADYLRVDQHICCYVPGEVSHIENIMAKEYKERSTRRLRRSEDTVTAETYSERENMTDTSSTEHNEMHSETAKVIAESKALNLGSSFQAHYGTGGSSGVGYSLNLGLNASYATSSSSQTSASQAASIAKDITYRATERVYSRVSEQRVSKMVDEFEEQNKHGFDNRGEGAENISGVYRWVDTVLENRLISYGRRLMYEFTIPEPASFHKEAITKPNGLPAGAVLVEKPEDPRKTGPDPLTSHQKLTRANYGFWAAQYAAEVEAPPSPALSVGKSFSYAAVKDSGYGEKKNYELFADKDSVRIPEGYYTTGANVMMCGLHDENWDQQKSAVALVGNLKFASNGTLFPATWEYIYQSPGSVMHMFEGEVPVSVTCGNFFTFSVDMTIDISLTSAAFERWQAETYAAILSAYESKLAAYNKALAEALEKAADKVRPVNPAFNRQIEAVALRKNCMTLLTGPNYPGQNHLTGTGDLRTITPLLTASLDGYASVLRFMELAFEWEIMSYTYYPFYWGDRNRWSELYNAESDDQLFRSFLQSGMARVIATVRPGFERAVLYYMATGKVWESAEPPVFSDQVIISVLAQVESTDEKELAKWETRVPTTLTVIQDSTVGLDASGLPCACGENGGEAEPDFEGKNRQLSRLLGAEAGGGEPM